ncbi:uncharacterized protein [Procambarus clarkii]|uniref:uncharacterized protein n=1 Tax=Procambarus clarkii TaxID=6728 RepID=UPI00374480E0
MMALTFRRLGHIVSTPSTGRSEKDMTAVPTFMVSVYRGFFLELANTERDRLKEQAALQREALQLQKEQAAQEREREKEQAALQREQQAALQREREKEQAALQREREQKQLELRERELEIQREHEKKQAAMALDQRKREFDLETTHHTRRQHQQKLPFQSHLTGRAAVTLSTMASETDYKLLKKAVLDAYLLSFETYRRKFGDYLKASATICLEFENNKTLYFMKWLEAAQVSTFTDLVNLILVEEFPRRVPNPIRLYLADKEETDLTRCAQLADSYSLIHRVPSDTPSSKTSWFSPEKVPVSSEPFSHTINYDEPLSQTSLGNGPVYTIPCSTIRYSTALSVQNSMAANVVKHLGKQCPQYGHLQESQNKCDTISHDRCKTIYASKVLENPQSSTLAIGTPSYRSEMGSYTPTTINFMITIYYIKDSDNVVADALSKVHEVEHSTPTILHSAAVE